MAYGIELMSIGQDLYPVLRASAAQLNSVQAEFAFRLTSEPQRSEALGFQRAEYSTQEVWEFLRTHRARFGGNRPYIIAFVNARLRSSELSNIFGSHEADEGLAVVTVLGSAQYVREERRYCSYYLVRYSLSFVNPSIRAHDDSSRKDCYFHRKLFKPDIRASMDSGAICDICSRRLDNPSADPGAKPLSADEREALRRMRQVVSGDYPHAIVMKGGGVKGLAFAAALVELEKHFWFDRHVGVSAGAIAAVLLAAGYLPTELVSVLSRKNFRDFIDARVWKVPLNLLFRRGCYPGEGFRIWIATLIDAKVPKQSEVLMKDLNGALIYACRRGPGTVVFDSQGERKDTAAAFAARCSMSIPLVFIPQMVDGRRVYDGGLRNNFPVSRFLTDHPGQPFVALYLGQKDNQNRKWMGSELLDIVIDGEEKQTVDANAESVVVIDTSPVGTVDFGLGQVEKDFLLKIGRASALRFLLRRKLDDGPTEREVTDAEREAEQSRTAVRRLRKHRWRRRGIVGALLLALVYLAALAVRSFFVA